jgi:hypothetical protein
LAKILTHLRTEDIADNSQALLAKVKMTSGQLTAYDAFLMFRRLMILHSRAPKIDLQDTISHCFNIVTEVLSLQKEHAPAEFVKSKISIVQAFCASSPSFNLSPLENSQFMDGFFHPLWRLL